MESQGAVATGRESQAPERDEDRLQHALRGTSDGMWDWDLLTDGVYYSPRWKEMLGYAAEELPDHLDTWRTLVNPDDRDRVLATAEDFAKGKLPRYEVEFRMRHKDGRWIWILARAALIRDPTGRPVRLVGTHVDITARKDAMRLLEIQRDLAIELSRSRNLRQAYEALLRAATTLPGFDCGGIYQRLQDGGLELMTHRGLSAKFVAAASRYAPGTQQANVAARGELMYAVRRDLPSRIVANLELDGLEALAVVPLRVEGKVVGILNASSHRHPQIDTGSRVALESLAAQAEGAIARIHAEEEIRAFNETLEQRVQQRTDEWLAANQALHETQAKYQRLHESMMDAFACADAGGRLVEWNRSFQEMTGFAAEELGRMTYMDLTPERWHAFEARFSEQVVERGWSDVYEKEYYRKDGSVFPVELRGFLLRDAEGRPIGSWALVRDISKRKAAEAEARRVHDQLRLVANHAPLLISECGTDCRYKFVNGRYQEMFGVDPASLIGKHPREVLGEDAFAVAEPHVAAALAGRVVEYDLPVSNLRSEPRVLHVCHAPTFDDAGAVTGFVTAVQDITERKAAEEEVRRLNETLNDRVRERTRDLESANQLLRESRERFRQLGEAVFDGILITENGRIIDANHQLLAMFGYELSEIIGRPVLEFVAPGSRGLVARKLQDEVEGSYESLVLRRDGTEFPCEARARNVTMDGRRIRLTTLRDLTESRRAAADLARLRVQLERFRRFAELNEISLGVIHQISQPLSAMANNVAAALAWSCSCVNRECGTREALVEIEADLKRARETVTSLRALSHPERPHRVPADPNDVVSRLVELLLPEAGARQIQLDAEYGRDLPPVCIDEVQIHQAVINLVRNAFDAISGSGEDLRRVTLATRADGGDAVEILVHDLGCGIAAEYLPRLFEPFFTTKPDGMGVGLRLAQTIVEAHGGTLEGFNNEGPGTTFRIRLPREEGRS